MSGHGIGALRARVDGLERQIGIEEDVNAIRALQFTYGYCMDKFLLEDVVELFAEKAELNLMGAVYRGKAGARRLYVGRIGQVFTGGKNGPVDGYMWDYLQMQDIIDVSPDRQTAIGRFRYLMQAGDHVSKQPPSPSMGTQCWESGTYVNSYIKEDGVWKIWKFDPRISWRADYQTGWRYTHNWLANWRQILYPEDPLGPDEFNEGENVIWPKAFIHPFHYPHPVTGKEVGPPSRLSLRDKK